MQSINFQGLNCYHNCIVSIANHLGVDFPCAFFNLWSETDYRYEVYRKVYLTQRLIKNFEALGQKLEIMLPSSPVEAKEHLSASRDGEFIIVGMDAFYIPWNQFYQTFHGPHYFVARNESSEEFLCFDPTYDSKNQRIPVENITAHAFDISRLHSVVENPPVPGITGEASEIIRIHGDTRQRILKQIENCAHEESECIILLAKYVDAMISNRHLFVHYLENKRPLGNEYYELFGHGFFSKWTAVKNGLYKLSIKKNDNAVRQEVCQCFDRVMDEELSIAERILSGAR